jgi:short-subunit dehydrogenase
LESQVAVVTGAARGVGAAVAKKLANMGAHVVLVARGVEQLNRVRDEIVHAGGKASVQPCDLIDAAAVEGLGKAVAETHNRCDILVTTRAWA